MKSKKILNLIISSVLSMSLLVGCSNKEIEEIQVENNKQEIVAEATTQIDKGYNLVLGMIENKEESNFDSVILDYSLFKASDTKLVFNIYVSDELITEYTQYKKDQLRDFTFGTYEQVKKELENNGIDIEFQVQLIDTDKNVMLMANYNGVYPTTEYKGYFTILEREEYIEKYGE